MARIASVRLPTNAAAATVLRVASVGPMGGQDANTFRTSDEFALVRSKPPAKSPRVALGQCFLETCRLDRARLADSSTSCDVAGFRGVPVKIWMVRA
ncbi:hypothetical protein GCM10009565_42660 [Amycolatopsis albidoflavus]